MFHLFFLPVLVFLYSQNSDLFWKLRIGVQADVGSSLKQLTVLLNQLAPIRSELEKQDLDFTKSPPCDSVEPPSILRLSPPSWLAVLRAREDQRDAEIEESARDVQPNSYLNPLQVLWRLEHEGLGQQSEVSPADATSVAVDDEDSIIVADGGDFVASASYIIRPRRPLSWLDPGPFGTLGVGGGFALGAKLCRPNVRFTSVKQGSRSYSFLLLG
ncbi:unnamed protein product [Protopolystoma xenopodis]|uniref:Thiamine pyrophosphate enzyme TPP-binding domain-containing protein n=1 Tax=Protopolystoma xenopodis TaxID=117903 RepID=A0A3S5B1C4_9PLAT|nr:unnamed protein product [Protopolystoma xenopodis]